MAEFVGGFIDPTVITQLQKRADIYKKKAGRTPEDLNFMNSRNAWVRVISSVDVLNPITIPGRITFNSIDSKNYVLSNLSSIKGTGDSLSYATNSGIDFNNKNTNAAYQYSEDTGVRPKPGITSFSVTSKGRFGTIREANISFNVWSRGDLDAVERIYFRPGYSCIVEWGHTVYVDNTGKVQTSLSGFNSNLKDYFDNTKTFNNILNLLSNNTGKNSNNYQAFIGFVKNFNWSFRNDGGYDCSISIISQGEVLESLKMTFDNAGEVDKSQLDSKYEQNLIYKFLSDLRKESKDIVKSGIPARLITLGDIGEVESDNLNIYRGIPGSITTRGVKPIAVKKYARSTGKKHHYYYFPLRTLVHLLNEGFAITGKNCQKIAEIDSLSLEQYFTFRDHFSGDPLICILPNKKVKLEAGPYTTVFDTTDSSYIKLIEGAGREEDRGSKILDILITDILVEKALDNGPETVLAFLNYILSEITNALGGVNEFILQEEESSLKLKIKDVAVLPSVEADQLENKKAEIPISGLQSILTDLKIQSKISKDLASMIAIGAQTGPSRSAEDVTVLTQWNAGLQDRFAGNKNQGTLDCRVNDTGKEKEKNIPFWVNTPQAFSIYALYLGFVEWINRPSVKKIEKSFIELAANAYYRLYFVGDSATYNAPLFDTVKNKGMTYFKQQAGISLLPGENEEQNQSSAKKVVAKGVIPVELSFTTDGIGGIKVGQVFKVSPGVLPKKYDEFGYIVTGIDHSIDNNRWYTNVKSQLFVIPSKPRQGNSDIKAPQGRPVSRNTVPTPFSLALLDTRLNDGPFMNHLRRNEYEALSIEIRNNFNNKYVQIVVDPSEDPTSRGLKPATRELVGRIFFEVKSKYPEAKIEVTSGYRTSDENEQVGGVPGSYHLEGMAVDIAPRGGITVQQLAQIALDLGAGGVGVYSNHVHVDVGRKRNVFYGGRSN